LNSERLIYCEITKNGDSYLILPMEIIKAVPADLIEVLYLLRVCVLDMNSRGWFYWDLQSPLIKEDIDNNTVFLYKQNEMTFGMISFNLKEIPEYRDINWNKASSKPLLIHHLMVHPKWREKGIAKQLITFAERYGRENGFTSLRLDVLSENQEAVSLYRELSYQQMGEVTFHYQKVPYYCFEKRI